MTDGGVGEPSVGNDESNERAAGVAPSDAFSILGDETRLQILQVLGAAAGPLAFSKIEDRLPGGRVSNFNYHLGKLEGHFVRKTGDGYELRQAGRRVLEAVLSGAVTEAPELDRTRIDWPCFLCGEPVEVGYREERVGMYCPSCRGTRGDDSATASSRDAPAEDVLGFLSLPPAGVRDRSPAEVLRAASILTTTEAMAVARGVCPRCSATVSHTVEVCDSHEPGGGHCPDCDQRFGITIDQECSNCVYAITSPFATHLLADPHLIAFMVDHEIDLLDANGFHLAALAEELVSTDPFEARFTFTADGESLTLTVDDDLDVVDARRRVRAELD